MKTDRADGEVDTLQVLGAVHAEALVDNTTLLARLHRAGTERVPSGLDVVGNPIVDRLVVLLGVLDVLVDLGWVVYVTWLVPRTCNGYQSSCPRMERQQKRTHVDADGETVGENALGGLDVDVLARSRRRRVEVRVVGSQFATISLTHMLSAYTAIVSVR